MPLLPATPLAIEVYEAVAISPNMRRRCLDACRASPLLMALDDMRYLRATMRRSYCCFTPAIS